MSSKILAEVLEKLVNDFRKGCTICPNGRNAWQIDLGQSYKDYGFIDDYADFVGVTVLAPVESLPNSGLAGFVDTEEMFKGYQQLDSGLAVPNHIASLSGLPHHDYKGPATLRILLGTLTPRIMRGDE
ncbi:hypothetical protein HY485_01270 [Candidatus Woesearchaeota archaeon]|nr:hypothetical protein [Candidatus Woesearchaeota archaeon]